VKDVFFIKLPKGFNLDLRCKRSRTAVQIVMKAMSVFGPGNNNKVIYYNILPFYANTIVLFLSLTPRKRGRKKIRYSTKGGGLRFTKFKLKEHKIFFKISDILLILI
jgi:hypothetical protein